MFLLSYGIFFGQKCLLLLKQPWFNIFQLFMRFLQFQWRYFVCAIYQIKTKPKKNTKQNILEMYNKLIDSRTQVGRFWYHIQILWTDILPVTIRLNIKSTSKVHENSIVIKCMWKLMGTNVKAMEIWLKSKQRIHQ